MKYIYTILFSLFFSYHVVAQTTLVADINQGAGSSNPVNLANSNGTIFFAASNGTPAQGGVGQALWKYNGSDTTLVRDIRTGGNGATANIVRLLPVNGGVFFRANDDSNGKEAWFSDGTESGTNMILDINPSGSSNVNNYINVNGTVYFLADDGGLTGAELWTSDGTTGNTALVRDINVGAVDSNPQNLVEIGGIVYFTAKDDASGFELWRSNGTFAGTTQVLDIQPGVNPGFPKFLTDVSGTLFFQADDGTNGIELWTSDGTGGGTNRVSDINPAGSAFIRFITNLNGLAIFQANDGSTGEELWISDGTTLGTQQVLDINPGAANSTPENFIVSGDIIYFTASDGTNGLELWRSDGTAPGTFMVRDINPGGSSAPHNLLAYGGSVFFSADDGTNGIELWKSDGTSEGTVLVNDINPTGSSNPDHLVIRDGVIYFSADDGSTGNELHSTVVTQAFNLNSSGVTGSTVDLNWENGSGTRRIVVCRQGGPTYRSPVDGTDYVANAQFQLGSNIGGAHYVVYDGTGTDVTVTGLDPTTTYYFSVFEYLGTGTGTDYITEDRENLEVVTVGTNEPTQIGSNMIFSSITESSFQVSWDNTGDGSSRIVVARRGSPVTRKPNDGVTYAAGSVFAQGGANLGGQQYVVYNSSGNTFNLSGLEANTTYHLAVYEYNGLAGEENYLVSNALIGSQITTAPSTPEPTSIASSMSFANISETSMEVSWINTGDGTNRIVVARKGNAVTKSPNDGVTYAFSNMFDGGGANIGGEQYVVYNGSGNSFLLSGLEFSTTYHLAVFEYNGTTGNENYLTSQSLIGSQITAGILEPTTIASNAVIANITDNSFDLSWDNTGDGSNRLVVVRENKGVSRFPIDGQGYIANSVFAGGGSNLGGQQYVVYNASGNSLSISGLNSGTTYHFAVLEYNGTGGTSNYLTNNFLSGSATTTGLMMRSNSEVITEHSIQESQKVNPNDVNNSDYHIDLTRDAIEIFGVNVQSDFEVRLYDIQGNLLYSGRSDKDSKHIIAKESRYLNKMVILLINNGPVQVARKYYIKSN